MKRLVFIIIFALPQALFAAQDAMLGGWAFAEKPGSLRMSYTQSYRVDKKWYDGANRLRHPTQGQQYLFRKGVPVSRKIASVGVFMGWQATAKDFFGLYLPAYFTELSRFRLDQAPPSPLPLNDPQSDRQDQVGDLDLHWRRGLLRQGGATLAFSTGLRVPLGTHMFESGQTLLGMGSGGYEVNAGLHSAIKISVQRLWVDGRVHYPLGYQATVPSGAFLSPSSVWPSGAAFVRPAVRVELVGGYLIDWHQSDSARHSFALELSYTQQGETRLGNQLIAGSASSRLDLLPQMHFRFNDSFTVMAGFGYPLAGSGSLRVACGSSGICEPDIRARVDIHLK